MTIQEYVYRVTPPYGRTVDEVLDALVPAAKSMVANQWIVAVQIDVEETFLDFIITMKGHDRWWIRRRAPYLVVAILTRAELEAKDVNLEEVRGVRSLRQARFWTEGHNKGTRIFLPPDGSDPPLRKKPKCRRCDKQEAEFHSHTGWHQTYP